jgi:putative aminopeptidase FrvX
VFALDANAFASRPGPRLVDGIEVMARLFNPNLFSPVDPAFARAVLPAHALAEDPMLTPASVSFLKQLLDTPGPSGRAAAAVWRAQAASATARQFMAVVNDGGGPTILLAGHIDEIGVIVTYIDDDGFVYIAPIGGWDPQVLVAQRIRFLGRNGEVLGVIGKKPIHLMKPDEREKASKITDLWVDIGPRRARGRGGAQRRRRRRDRLSARCDFPNDRIVSRSIDDRIGAFVVLEALRRYAAEPGEARVVAVATTQEEIGYRGGGALVAAHSRDPRWRSPWTSRSPPIIPGRRRRNSATHRSAAGRCSRAAR